MLAGLSRRSKRKIRRTSPVTVTMFCFVSVGPFLFEPAALGYVTSLAACCGSFAANTVDTYSVGRRAAKQSYSAYTFRASFLSKGVRYVVSSVSFMIVFLWLQG